MGLKDIIEEMEENSICSHHWVHNAGKQCEWDRATIFPWVKKIGADSNNLCYFYICTMCGEELWSQNKLFNIPHYRVRTREVK